MAQNGTKFGRWVAIAAILLGWLSSIVGAAWWAGSDRTRVHMQIDANCGRLDDHEIRLRVVERIGADVRWIRQDLENRPDP